MNTYYGCGILKDIPYIIDNPGDFQIQDLGQNNPDRYIYPGDSIKYELDSELVCCIVDIEHYYCILFRCSSKCRIQGIQFNSCILRSKLPVYLCGYGISFNFPC